MQQWNLDEEPSEVQPGRDAERSMHTFDDATRRIVGRVMAPIGVFDSGAGGLTILSALRQELPQEDYIYIGDTAHCPYGVRSDAEIAELTTKACQFLIGQGVKLIVIACNTASQAALNVVRSTFDVPFVGVVPAVKPAARATRRGRIGVAATNQAVKAAYLHHLIEDFAAGVQVYAVGCPELVTLVEHGELAGPVVEETLQNVLHPLLSENVDVLVLGCTHFPAMRSAIERVVGKNVLVIDSGAAVARRTRAVLETESLVRPTGAETRMGLLNVWCSGNAEAFSSVASKVLDYPVIAHHVLL
ncbi:MAG: hypothetical protein NVSMB54_18230 [Ktedonobacteraceae bacterium]